MASAVLIPVELSLMWFGTTINGNGSVPCERRFDEHIGDEHRHGAVGKVHDTAAAVLEDESQPEDGESGARAEAEDQKEEVAGHG